MKGLERWTWVRAPLYRSHGRRQNSLRISHFPNAVQQRLISGLINTFRSWIGTMGTHAACMMLHAPELQISGRRMLLAKGACPLGAAPAITSYTRPMRPIVERVNGKTCGSPHLSLIISRARMHLCNTCMRLIVDISIRKLGQERAGYQSVSTLSLHVL